MSYSTPITGAAVTGLTSPTYTLVLDGGGEQNQLAYIISALGGTQTNVQTHNVLTPFQLIETRPKVVRSAVNIPATAIGLQTQVPVNEHRLMTRKGVAVNGSGAYARAFIETRFVVPGPAVYYDLSNLKAMLSCHVGALVQDPDKIINMITNGGFRG